MLAHYALQEGGKALEEGLKVKTENECRALRSAFFFFLAQRKIILIFAPEKIAKLYQNKKIGGDEAILSPSKESNPQHT